MAIYTTGWDVTGVVGKKPRFADLRLPVGWTDSDVSTGQKSKPAVYKWPVNPGESRRAIQQARAAVLQGQAEMAERLYRESLVNYPKSWTGWLEIARFHETHGNLNLAAQDYRQATRLWPERGKVWQLRGKCAEARLNNSPDWSAVDEARLCYTKAMRLGQPSKSALDRVNLKAKAMAQQSVDLSTVGACELRLGRFDRYVVGDLYADHPMEGGDPISGYSNTYASGEWYPLAALPGEDLLAYLERSFRSSDCEVIEPDSQIAGGLWRGRVVWLRSAANETSLCLDGLEVGQVNSPRARWPLKNPFARFRDRQTNLEIQLFRSSMFEIGLEISGEKVVAVYLAEPGRLRVNLQRLPRYRQT